MTILKFSLFLLTACFILHPVCEGQERVYAADPGDHFRQAVDRAVMLVCMGYRLSSQTLKSIEEIKQSYAAGKQQLFTGGFSPDMRKATMNVLQEQFEKELSGVLDREQYAYYLAEKERIVRLQSRVWVEGGKLLRRNAPTLAVRETQTMQQRYGLSDEQSVRVSAVNQSFYSQLTTLAEQQEADRTGYRESVQRLQKLRQGQLQEVLTPSQYAAYRQDMEGLAEQTRKEAEAAGQNREK